ncbi:MAG: competence/damage-inducible protein A [Peptococcaceae bacterium]|nr:competence/damage-inducible protein A [Peptococcaceae bacterium]
MKNLMNHGVTAEVIATGTELLLGKTLNISTQYLSEQLSGLGIEVRYHVTVGDHRERLKQALTTACGRSDLVLLTGGLGPTYDDLTREVVAEVAGAPLVFDGEQSRRIEAFFQGKPVPEGSERQARFPEGCLILDNPRGTAPGAWVMGEAMIIFLPGPPQELVPMFVDQVLERLRRWVGARGHVRVRVLKVFGLQETELERRIEDHQKEWRELDPDQVLFCTLLDQHTYLDMRLCVRELPEEEAMALLEKADGFWSARLGLRVFARDEQTHVGVVGDLLKERGLTLATAESCTGGLLGGRVTEVSGSSAYYQGGVISYANRAKQELLGVHAGSLERWGAVSECVAREMAQGARKALHSDVALATTGIAGPEGGTAEKPVGLVYIALAHGEGEEVLERCMVGERESVRDMTVETALDLLRRWLLREGQAV